MLNTPLLLDIGEYRNEDDEIVFDYDDAVSCFNYVYKANHPTILVTVNNCDYYDEFDGILERADFSVIYTGKNLNTKHNTLKFWFKDGSEPYTRQSESCNCCGFADLSFINSIKDRTHNWTINKLLHELNRNAVFAVTKSFLEEIEPIGIEVLAEFTACGLPLYLVKKTKTDNMSDNKAACIYAKLINDAKPELEIYRTTNSLKIYDGTVLEAGKGYWIKAASWKDYSREASMHVVRGQEIVEFHFIGDSVYYIESKAYASNNFYSLNIDTKLIVDKV